MPLPRPAPPEPNTRERVDRAKLLARRGLAYWKTATLIFLIVGSIGIYFAMNTKRSYQSECIIGLRPGTRDSGEDSRKRTERLRDMLTTPSRLEQTIKKFGLYPRTVEKKGIRDAVDDMRPHVGFRSRESGRYYITFDAAEEGDFTPRKVPPRTSLVPSASSATAPATNLDARDLVRDVTRELAESLIEEYSTGNFGAVKQDAEFLAAEVRASESSVEKTTRDLTVFLSLHPEFAAQGQPGVSHPLPKAPKDAPAAPRAADPALMALYQNDGQLAALYRQRARLESELRPASTAPAPTPAPPAAAATQEQIAAAQSEVDTATKRVAEAQADVASKAGRLTEEHPDMRASRGRAAQAAADLAQARNKLAALKAQQVSPTPGTAPDDANPELKAKLAEINAQIGNREAELKRNAVGAPTGPSPAPSASQAPVPEVSPIVALETEWQRLVRAVSEARSRHDEVRKRYEVARLTLQSAQSADQPLMVIEPAFRPTSPFKGGRTPVALGGLSVALLLGLLYMAARVAFDDTIINAGDIETLRTIPLLGVIPRIDLDPSDKGKHRNVPTG
jgi:predicted  nucleic acid-binding Zn-ribbon protein